MIKITNVILPYTEELSELTHKQLEMHGFQLSIAATDALVLSVSTVLTEY